MKIESLGIIINVDSIPDYMVDGVVEYLVRGVIPGGFLTAVFENDLVGAFAKADETNTTHMREWAEFLYNSMPAQAWGSPEKVAAWARMRYEASKPKEVTS